MKKLIILTVLMGVMTPPGGMAIAASLPSPYEVELSPSTALVKVKFAAMSRQVGLGLTEVRLPLPKSDGVRINEVKLDLPEYHVMSMRVENGSSQRPLPELQNEDGEEDFPHWARENTAMEAEPTLMEPVLDTSFMDPEYGPIDKNTPRGRLIVQLRSLREQEATLSGQLQAVEASIARWNVSGLGHETQGGLPAILPDAETLERLNAATATQLPQLFIQKQRLETERKLVRTYIAQAVAQIRAFGGAQNRTNFLVVTIEISGHLPDKPVSADYSYYDANAGWYPSYSFNADPDKKNIRYTHSATVWQNSPVDWNGARLVINTLSSDMRLQPTPIIPWQVSLQRDESMKMGRSALQQSPAAPLSSDRIGEIEATGPFPFGSSLPARPEQIHYSTFSEWKLGQQNVESGKPITLPLDEGVWEADFFYTVRPAKDDTGFLTAKAKLPKGMAFGRGEATYLNSGRYVGEGQFGSCEQELTFFFGADKLITAKMDDLVAQTGESGFFSKSSTMDWKWRMSVKNGRDKIVKIRVEDPEPQLRDRDITLKVDSNPKPESKDKTWYWEREIAPGEEFVIQHEVSVSAPADKTLYPGRGIR